jgi:hypothetical protein
MAGEIFTVPNPAKRRSHMGKREWLGLGLAALITPQVGCVNCGYHCFNDLADPCRLPRYSALARQEVAAPLLRQAGNGLALEQTVWVSHFRAGSDELTPAGMAHLSRLARRQPEPVPYVFVQTAHDLPLQRGKEQEWASQRAELDRKRVEAVQAYLRTIRPEVAFHVAVHDPPEVRTHGREAEQIVRSMHRGATGQAVFTSFTGSGTGAGGAGTATTTTSTSTAGSGSSR